MFTFISFLLTISILFIHVEINSKADTSKLNLSISPEYDVSNYDIAIWTKKLNLQTCAIIEIGEGYCSLFLENKKFGQISEYFLGICECSVMTNWQLCSPMLTNVRPKDCTFYNNDTTSRVHRRLCDISAISEWGDACNCTKMFEGIRLRQVIGFPTCLKPPLPDSICHKNPCGTSACQTKTIKGGIHKVSCSKKCYGQKPFCEQINTETSMFPHIKSRWTSWEILKENVDRSFITAIARCIDLHSKKPALDCLGPGTKCCTKGLGNCICAISNSLGYLILTRTSTKPTERN